MTHKKKELTEREKKKETLQTRANTHRQNNRQKMIIINKQPENIPAGSGKS